MLGSFSKIVLSVLVATALTKPASAGNRGKCPKQTTPPDAGGHEKCAAGEDVSMIDIINCASGEPEDGFDDNKKDFDIIRDIIYYLGLDGALECIDGLGPITLFLPMDFAFYDLAKWLGYDGGYDEQKIYDLFVSLGVDILTKVVTYHISNDKAYEFLELQTMTEIGTLEGDEIIISEKAKSTSNCNKRVRLKDSFRLALKPKERKVGFPKIHNKFQDIETCNGNIQVIKAVLLPSSIA